MSQQSLEIIPSEQECAELVKVCRDYFDPCADDDLRPEERFTEHHRRQVARMERIRELVGLMHEEDA